MFFRSAFASAFNTFPVRTPGGGDQDGDLLPPTGRAVIMRNLSVECLSYSTAVEGVSCKREKTIGKKKQKCGF